MRTTGIALLLTGLTGFTVGGLWIFVYYLTAGMFPIGDLGGFNVIVGGIVAAVSVLPTLIGLVLFVVGKAK